MNDDLLYKLGDYLLGTCKDVVTVLDYLDIDDIDPEDLECELEGINIERCSCGWWFESCELIDGDGEVVGCLDCR